MKSWFNKGSGSSGSPKASSILSSSRNASTNHVAIDPRQAEISDLQDAMEAAARIVNDDIEGAETQLRLRHSSSSFHALGLGIAVFMRSILGFEKEVMAEAGTRLADCEARAWADMKKAQKLADGGGGGWFRGGGSSANANVSAHGCEIYPPGTEFQLLNAEAQLMGAMISVMNESLTEGIKGFYKLRKAFVALDAILEAEARVLPAKLGNGVAKATTAQEEKEEAMEKKALDSDSDLEFVDAAEDTELPEPPATYTGHLEKQSNGKSVSDPNLDKAMDNLNLDPVAASSMPGTRADTPESQKQSSGPLPNAPRRTLPANNGPDSSSFTNPVDAFVHSGANMCFGILLLVISMVPPAFSRLLYIIGFKGDRDRGVQMLWQSTKFNNVNGGVAGLMLLGYYNGLLAFADILPSKSDAAELAEEDEIVGYPQEHCVALLESMREQYPDSRLWKVEEARVLANERRLEDAIDILKANSDSKMRQVTALNGFELSVNALFMMDWQTMRDGFLRCVELNDWSHALYYYFVGCAELEMYRNLVQQLKAPETDAKEKGSLEADLKRHKKAAEEYFRKCPAAAGRKKFMARQMPFEVFALRKVAKWEARAKEWGVDLADAVGVSPGQEMTYLWTGCKRMPSAVMEKALKYLSWDRCTASEELIKQLKAVPDEAAIKAVAESALLCNLGRHAEARERVKPVSEQDRMLFKGENRDDWTLPCAHYELAVIAWKESCDPSFWPTDVKEIDAFRQSKVRECEEYLEHVKTWEAFVLDARIGMKVKTGLDSISWLRKKKGWTL
ncbi:Mitochondrial outer membrane protein iml2 [Gnomoniopsis smithogilvyi]|uniref:Inclusion body clearance protein IML2 n=1 Tax=Gnomoniopsis smithogilvyi TaxID=1191159 RepID=A0A9W9CWS3_9PEZI|nr:Mitochondrial outer membrane protein iml2 [Gnomoniopsis smithogilvyi]